MAVINKLSIFIGQDSIKTVTEDDVQVKEVIETWLPKTDNESEEEL